MEIRPGARVAVSGAGGFVGSALTRSLGAEGVTVLRLVRREAGSGEISWDPDRGTIDRERLDGVDGVVHLAGESIAGVWTPARKRRILASRTLGTRLLATTLATLDRPPEVLVSASGVGYYGDAGDVELTEASPPGDDFLARVCVGWEQASEPAARGGVRVVNTRFGLVLDPSGGALATMLPAFRLGLGARLGDGRQWLSWISLPDVVAVLRRALTDPSLYGPVNAVAPRPVRNREFTAALGKALHRPAVLAVPAPVLRAVTGGMADALLLASQKAVPAVLERAGFAFQTPTIDGLMGRVLDAGG